MLLMVIPISRMLSSIFMKFIARVGTVNEEKWAAMGMGSILTIAAAASGAFRKRGGFPGRGGGGGNGGGEGSRLNEAGGPGGGPSSVAMDALGISGSPGDPGGAGSGGISPIGGAKKAPLDNILKGAGDASSKAALGGAGVGALSPVAGPAVAGAMALATKALAGPVATAHGIRKELRSRAGKNQETGMGRHDALVRAAMDITGASSRSEANARIIGSVLGSPFGATGAKFGSARLGNAVSWVNKRI